MKNPVSVFFGIVCLFFIAGNIYIEHSGKFIVSPVLKLVLVGVFIVFLTIAVNPFKSKNAKKIWLWILFLYYIWVLANLLFFDVGLGRDDAVSGMNLKPFYTIRNYLTAYEHGNIASGHVILNLAGNIAAFMPMAIFLPSLFRSQHNILMFFLTIFIMVATVEGMQYITHTGSCDVDDLILNVFGAMVLWIALLPYRLIMRYRERYR